MPLTAKEALEVVRYWAAAVRHAEGLACRLRVEPSRPRQAPIDVLNPDWGARYAKLVPGAGGDDPVRRLLLREATSLTLPVSGDVASLFEGWLRGQYRASMYRAMGLPTDSDDGWYVAFPALHDRGRAELDALLRIPVERLDWRAADGAPWTAPSYAARRKGAALGPPATLRLHVAPAEGAPFAVSEQVLSRALAVGEDDLAALSARLDGASAPAVLDALADVLGGGAGGPVERLVGAMNARLPAGLRAWDVALLFDGGRQAPTAGLLAELRSLLDAPDLVKAGTPLHAYLTGARPKARQGIVRALPTAEPLTPEQRRAFEEASSPLTACQGPPGTGKTRLVGTLLADAVVESAARIAATLRGWPRSAPTVVASTNNRAVDTALELLERGPERLGLTWRIGNQEVVATAACARLEQTLAWLDDPDVEVAPLGDARRVFAEARARVDAALGPLVAARREQERAVTQGQRLVDAERRLAEASAGLAGLSGARVPRGTAEAAEAMKALNALMGRLYLHLDERHLGRAKKAAKKLVNKVLPRALVALAAIGRPLKLSPPPPEPFEPDVWEPFIEDRGPELFDLGEELAAQSDPEVRRRQLEAAREVAEEDVRRLHEERVVVPPVDADALYDASVDLRAALFEAACALRESWARSERDALAPLLSATLAALRERGAPSRVLEDPATAHALLTLFPAVGCTLLSFRGSFPLEAGWVERLIVDEAGQCHPAYIVPALLRARAALIIGDVHQLEPIVETDDAEEERALTRSGCALDGEKLDPYRVRARRPPSAQALAERATGRVTSLRDHFRCQGPIIAISDRLCGYDLRVRTPPRSFGDRVPWLEAPVVLLPALGEQVADGGSWRNDVERDLVLGALRDLLDAGVPPADIAVLTPYRGQLYALRRGLRGLLGGRGDDWAESGDVGGIAVGTVHRFQGGERDVVLFSTVITRDRSLPFLNERVNLVNVAASRARVHLVVVGDPDVLSRGEVTRELVRAARVG
ncbi:MAG: hypothetical protein AMXMBFR64_30710 [Myxococcales bacterium]